MKEENTRRWEGLSRRVGKVEKRRWKGGVTKIKDVCKRHMKTYYFTSFLNNYYLKTRALNRGTLLVDNFFPEVIASKQKFQCQKWDISVQVIG